MTRLAVFDCDGTLVDSGAAIVRAMQACFAEHCLPEPCPVATRRVVGLSLVEAMAAMLPEGEPDLHGRLAGSYKSAFAALRERNEAHEPLFPGVAEGLAELSTRGWLIGVATGKSDRGLKHCLDAHNLTRYFVTLQTADRHPSKPHPAMLQAAVAETGAFHTVMIGDTSYDMEMGAAAGADTLGVAWGYHPPHELTRAGARAVADSFDHLLGLIDL